MANALFGATFPCFVGTAELPTTRGPYYVGNMQALSKQRLASDSIGNTDVTLTNVAVGSRYRLEVTSTGALVAEGAAAASTVPITASVYGAGSANNDITIKVRKGSSAQKYQPFETFLTLTTSAASVYIAQVADPIA